MADVASILAQFEAGIAGKDTGLGATVKFDFEGAGCIFLDGKSNPNTVSGEDQDADCTLTMSVETFEKMWPHIVNVSTILFVVFVVWTMKVRKSMKKAAKDVIIAEDRMHICGYREY